MRQFMGGVVFVTALAGLFMLGLEVTGADEKIPKNILTKKNPVRYTDAVVSDAKKAYNENCLQCHGEKGKGDGPMAGMLKDPPADLTDSQILTKKTDGEIFWELTKGRGMVMPPFESKLTDDQRWALVLLLRDISKTKPNSTPRAGR